MHIFYTIVKNPLLINLLIQFSRTQPSWPLKVFCKGDEKGLLLDKIKSVVLTLACHFEINVISPGYRILYLPPFCPAVLLWEGLLHIIPVSDVASHPLWEFYLQEPGPKPSEGKKQNKMNLWKWNIAFMKLEVFVDTCWMVINFTMVAFHVKVRKSHINITKERPDHFREKQAHSRSSGLPYFCSSHSSSCEHMRCTCHMPMSCVNGHFPWAFSWDIPLSFSSPSSLSILYTLFFS